jgi:hypothetical protein
MVQSVKFQAHHMGTNLWSRTAFTARHSVVGELEGRCDEASGASLLTSLSVHVVIVTA